MPSQIKNKMKREEVYHKLKSLKNKEKLKRRLLRKKLEKECEDPSLLPEKEKPKTQETKREHDETIVDPADEEVLQDEEQDEFADYFSGKPPKIIVTTSKRPSKNVYLFSEELSDVLPNAELRRRENFDIDEIMKVAIENDYTDIIVVNEDKKEPNALLLIHLPYGPTAFFRLKSIRSGKSIKGHGRSTGHYPELILNNFNTRLGHTIGRMFASIFPQMPDFKGRQAVTLHNQRDFIFFRRHRYIFDSDKKVSLQEIGPRFTLKLKWLQKGLFNPKSGEYEWYHKPDLDTSRVRFFL
ncbi:Brix-domain-containing protein [Rozella allomycis CSF55]|uniref:Brix-domain-containing protein n=1 Tax=Rozella allomycis (strain CSF55) TaxID=988480 RepID=A0A075AVH6_ROZAC|nr:Brix domain-containing protein [Rozella allomycis CSF55]RKP21978.1 Brix-domain-containing protein [Rozella allomycis CSF55]|eukprot:EPZ32707.1 Brix domain-containing protein [Rozella allomycis CSF55]